MTANLSISSTPVRLATSSSMSAPLLLPITANPGGRELPRGLKIGGITVNQPVQARQLGHTSKEKWINMVKGKIHFVRTSKSNCLDVWVVDPNSDPRISSTHSVGVREIAAWLSDDVNSHLSAVKWIERLESLDGAEAKGYLGTGNAHHVGAVDEYIFFECEFVEDFKVLIQKEYVISILKFYTSAHEGDARNTCLDVECEVEGAQALNRYLELGGRLGFTDT